MTEYPKDGSTFTTSRVIHEQYRWKKYKPDGARQMGVPGRWQKRVWKEGSDWFKWENCDEPRGDIVENTDE